MDVKSPAAADMVSRPSSPPPAQPSRAIVALRRAGIALVGVGVAALTAAACVLSFEDLRGLAITGEAPPGLAYLYPAVFDALLAIALIAVLLLRGGRWTVRLQAGVVLVLLFAAAVAAEVATAVRVTVDVRQAAVVVAVAPWTALFLALWLWLLLINHAAARRAVAYTAMAGDERDIVPFPEADPPTAESQAGRDHPGSPVPPARREQRPHPWHPAHPDHPPVHHLPAERVTAPSAAPPMESAPRHDLPAALPVVGPTPAPETPEIAENSSADGSAEIITETGIETGIETGAGSADPPEAPVDPAPGRPVRWGDLIRPRRGDLLVHPPRGAVRGQARPESRGGERVETVDAGADSPPAPRDERTESPETTPRGDLEALSTEESRQPEVGDRDADTQPILAVTGKPSPARRRPSGPARDPGPGAPPTGEDAAEEVIVRAEEESAAPPSGRVRSTPTPPEG